MSLVSVVLSLLGFVLLTLGTAVFVAAEFSLTALERSTVDANARTGGPRDPHTAPHPYRSVLRAVRGTGR